MSKLYYPEEILDSKFENNRCYYLIKWKGYKEVTWEPSYNISHLTDIINEYRDMYAIQNLNMMSGGYIYCRVSTKKQSIYNKGHTSLNVQEKEIRKYCEEKKINVIKVVHEAYSARNMEKMNGLNYLRDIAQPGQKIIVYDISRFSRNINQALLCLDELNKRNISIVSVTENITYNSAVSRNQFRLQLCASSYFSDISSEKVKASISFRKSRGDHIGSTSFGYTTEVDEKTNIRTKVPSVNEMIIIEMIRKIKDKNKNDILSILIKKNITFRNRKPTISGIIRIIKRFDSDLKITGKVSKQPQNTYTKPY